MSVDRLVKAVSDQDIPVINQLIKSGVSAYEVNSKGQTAIDAWFDSQEKGNEAALEVGQIILQKKPENESEFSRLDDLVKKQASRVAYNNGVFENIVSRGGHEQFAHISNQSHQHSRSCWAITAHAYTQFVGEEPSVDSGNYIRNQMNGYATAQALTPQIVAGIPVKLKNLNPVGVSENVIVEKIKDTHEKYGRKWKITRNGALVGADRNFVQLKPKDYTFHDDLEGLDSYTLGGIPNKMWIDKTPEMSLSEALYDKDWDRAKKLVDEGADINNLPGRESELIEHFQSVTSNQDMDALVGLGVDLSKPLSLDGSPARHIIQMCKTQSQFERAYELMKESDSGLVDNFKPETRNAQIFWENSFYSCQPTALENMADKLSSALDKFRSKNTKSTPSTPSTPTLK